MGGLQPAGYDVPKILSEEEVAYGAVAGGPVAGNSDGYIDASDLRAQQQVGGGPGGTYFDPAPNRKEADGYLDVATVGGRPSVPGYADPAVTVPGRAEEPMYSTVPQNAPSGYAARPAGGPGLEAVYAEVLPAGRAGDASSGSNVVYQRMPRDRVAENPKYARALARAAEYDNPHLFEADVVGYSPVQPAGAVLPGALVRSISQQATDGDVLGDFNGEIGSRRPVLAKQSSSTSQTSVV